MDAKLFDEASDVLKQTFSDIPFRVFGLSACRQRTESRAEADITAKLRFEKKEVTLFIEVRTSGQPRFVRDAANALIRYQSKYKNNYGIFMAPFISEEAGKILADENLGYIDFAGNCRICFGGIFISKEGKTNRFTKKRDLRSLYSPKAERVLRALMIEPKRIWKVEVLAEIAQVSLGQVSNVKKLLEGREWLRLEKGGFSLKEPEKLLMEWAVNYKFERNKVNEFYSQELVPDIEKQMAKLSGKENVAALTGFSAAARFAPVVRYNRVTAYVEKLSEKTLSELGWKRVTSGGNVTLLEPYDEGVFLGAIDEEGVKTVSPVQAYLDLGATSGRGEEAAEALLREVLKPSW